MFPESDSSFAVRGLAVLVIHIGTPKSGTKALQEYLRVNNDALLEQGVRYLKAGREKGRGTSHNELSKAIRGKADDAVWDRLRDELASSDSRINVISAEGLWLREPAEMRQQLPDVKDVQIVVYLRRQDRYLQSLYMQAVSSGRKHSFTAWRESVPDRGRYLDSIDDWAAAFGDDSIVVRPYERAGIVDTVADFSRLIGAENLAREHQRNPSPRWELLHFIRALNNLKIKVDEHVLFKALIGKDPAYARSCDLLTYEESAALLRAYEEENRILSESYYFDDSVPLFPELIPYEGPERWSMESEEYHKLTVDVLDVLLDFVADGLITRKGAKGRRHEKAAVEDGDSAGKGAERRQRRTERQKQKPRNNRPKSRK